MRAELDEPPVLEHRHPVGARGGGETVRDRDHRPPLRDDRERALDGTLGAGIDRRGCLVEDDHGRVREQHAREGDELALSG